MLLAAAIALLLTAEPELRPREVVEQELEEVLAKRPGPWGFIPGGMSIFFGLVTAFAGAHSNYHCTGDWLFTPVTCHHEPLVPWGQAAVGVGLTTAALGVIGMIVLGTVRASFGPRAAPLERELQAIRVAEWEEKDRLEREEEERMLEERWPNPEARQRFDTLESQRKSYALPIVLLAGGGGVALSSIAWLPQMLSGPNGASFGGPLVSALIVGVLTIEMLGIWQLVSRRAHNGELDERQRQLELEQEPVVPTPPPLPASPIESRLPAAPVFLGWSFAF